MTLETLNNDIVEAMKSGDNLTRDVLRSAVSNIKKAAIDRRVDITDALVDEILLKEHKTLQEMIDTCPVDRTDVLKQYQSKMQILKHYVPILITDEREINHLIYELCKGKDFPNIGAVMKFVMPQLKGKVDMKLANKVIKEMSV